MSKEGLERPKGGKIQAKDAQVRTEKASLPVPALWRFYVTEHMAPHVPCGPGHGFSECQAGASPSNDVNLHCTGITAS